MSYCNVGHHVCSLELTDKHIRQKELSLGLIIVLGYPDHSSKETSTEERKHETMRMEWQPQHGSCKMKTELSINLAWSAISH
jgi:hypothetical protein